MHHIFDPLRPSDAYIRHQPRPSLVQKMTCRQLGAELLTQSTLYYFQQDPWEQILVNCIRILTFPAKKIHLKMSSGNRRPFRLGRNVLRDLCRYITLIR